MSKPASATGMIMIGDAVAYALGPKAHADVWRFEHEPMWYRRMIAAASNRRRGALIALAEAALGVGFVLLARKLAHRSS